ncbi:MAG: PilZ domain-containing protein [Pseudomonadota bacterium]
MEDKRRYQRWQLGFYLQVFDQKSNFSLGEIRNISEGGMMLVGRNPLKKGKIYELWMEAPLETGMTDRVVFKAACVWVNDADQSSEFESGLEYQPLSSNADTFFSELIDYISAKHSHRP